MNDNLIREIDRRKAAGCRVYTLSAFENCLKNIGYKINRRLDCRGVAKSATGDTYPCITTGCTHISSGLWAFNNDAPRDANFAELQRLRFSAPIVVVEGALLEI